MIDSLGSMVSKGGGKNTDWKPLIHSSFALESTLTLADAYAQFGGREESFAAVVQAGRPVGLCSRGQIGFKMGSLRGHSQFSPTKLSEHVLENHLVIRDGTYWETGLLMALSRPVRSFNDDVVIVDQAGLFLGLVKVHTLVVIQSSLLAQKTTRLEEDIVLRKKIEEELREANKNLEDVLEQLQCSQEKVVQNERVSALGQMSAGIAHDFNSLLTPIMGYSELLLRMPDFGKEREKALRYVKIINNAASDASQIVRRLRESYRPREAAEKLTRINVNELVEQIVKLTLPRWKNQTLMQGIDVTLECDLAEVPAIRGNSAELREALTHLIFNAVDALPNGGEITVRTRALSAECVEVSVHDTGTGMTAEVRRRCIEPFFSTKGTRGVGLGLTMVSGIVTRHEGELLIDSDDGLGTLVALRLPACPGRADAEPDEHTAAGVPKMRLLVVDDESIVREIVCELLSSDGHVLETACNGYEALQKFNPTAFDMVITDFCMPEMNGDVLAARLKELAPSIPIILLTGVADFINKNLDNVDLVVSKPVGLEDMRNAILRVTSKRAKKRSDTDLPGVKLAGDSAAAEPMVMA